MNSHPYLGIPELVNLESGRGLVRVPCEEDVPFTSRVRALVDTAEFQRLRHITQLGLASAVYPGATHTRFEHALGVFHNAVLYLWQLGKDERFAAAVDAHAAEVLLAASLLHDLGHWPFCHPIEDMALPELPPHEEFAAEFLAPDGELAGVLGSEWQIGADDVLAVLAGESVVTCELSVVSREVREAENRQLTTDKLRLLRSILSGPVDVDKMDYLYRDSQHAGVPYGRNFDRSRLINSLVVNEAGDGLAITSKGKTAAELMVFARYVMFSEVYWHHAVRSATSMFARAFYELYRELDLKSLFRQSEAGMISVLRERVAGTDREPLIEGIFGAKRRLYKRVAEFSHYQSPEVYDRLARRPYGLLVQCATELAQRLSRDSKESIGPAQIVIDAPPPHREIEFRVDIYFPKEDVYRPLGEVSPVVDALARRQFDDYVKRVRIFADPQVAGRISSGGQFDKLLDQAIRACDD